MFYVFCMYFMYLIFFMSAAEETFSSRPIPDPTHPGARYVVRGHPSLRFIYFLKLFANSILVRTKYVYLLNSSHFWSENEKRSSDFCIGFSLLGARRRESLFCFYLRQHRCGSPCFTGEAAPAPKTSYFEVVVAATLFCVKFPQTLVERLLSFAILFILVSMVWSGGMEYFRNAAPCWNLAGPICLSLVFFRLSWFFRTCVCKRWCTLVCCFVGSMVKVAHAYPCWLLCTLGDNYFGTLTEQGLSLGSLTFTFFWNCWGGFRATAQFYAGRPTLQQYLFFSQLVIGSFILGVGVYV